MRDLDIGLWVGPGRFVKVDVLHAVVAAHCQDRGWFSFPGDDGLSCFPRVLLGPAPVAYMFAIKDGPFAHRTISVMDHPARHLLALLAVLAVGCLQEMNLPAAAGQSKVPHRR